MRQIMTRKQRMEIQDGIITVFFTVLAFLLMAIVVIVFSDGPRP